MTKQSTKSRTLSGRQVRKFFSQMAEDITAEAEAIRFTFRGNTFSFDLQGATINITINESTGKGGSR